MDFQGQPQSGPIDPATGQLRVEWRRYLANLDELIRSLANLEGTDLSAYAVKANSLSQFAATTSAELRSIISDESGDGALLFQGGGLGTPSAGDLSNCTALQLTTGVTGNLPVANLDSGTNATSSTYWRGDGTWATPSGGGGGSAHGISARVTASANQTIPNSTITKVTFNMVDYDDDSLFDDANDRFIIPAGVSRVILFGGFGTASTATTYAQVRFRHYDSGGTLLTDIPAAQQNQTPFKTSGPLAVSEDDYVEMHAFHSLGVSMTILNQFTNFSIEVLA